MRFLESVIERSIVEHCEKYLPYTDQGRNIQRECRCETDIEAQHSKLKKR